MTVAEIAAISGLTGTALTLAGLLATIFAITGYHRWMLMGKCERQLRILEELTGTITADENGRDDR